MEDSAQLDQKQGLTPRLYRRLEDRKAWDAYWKLRKLESDGTYYLKVLYLVHRAVDYPATWFREKIVEPLNDKYKLPYYHRTLNRVPEVDECGVDNLSCFYEADQQFRLDKSELHQFRFSQYFIITLIDDVEESELNFFIKYGELGQEGDVRDAYMKQKHRMIWERRHPEIMKAREEAYKEHKKQVAEGRFDYSFWKKGIWHTDKSTMEMPGTIHHTGPSIEGDKPLSFDWQFYKKAKEDPKFEEKETKTQSKHTIWGPW